MIDADHARREESQAPIAKTISRVRWWIHLLILGAYPIALGMLGASVGDREGATLLPKGTAALLGVVGLELAMFAVVFGIAWVASRANRDDLMLRWRRGTQAIVSGFVYSVLLRIGIGAVVALLALLITAAGSGGSDKLEQLRPRTEVVVDPSVLTGDPLYFLLAMTLVSFVMGGLREELWRAGMLAGLRAVFPQTFQTNVGRVVAVMIVAVAFGLGHLPQGWGGAGMTSLLGFGLGMIMVRRDSIWEAVFAHGFFNATSFLLLYFLALKYPGMVPH